MCALLYLLLSSQADCDVLLNKILENCNEKLKNLIIKFNNSETKKP